MKRTKHRNEDESLQQPLNRFTLNGMKRIDKNNEINSKNNIKANIAKKKKNQTESKRIEKNIPRTDKSGKNNIQI